MLILCESDFCHSFQFCFPAFLSRYIVAIPCSYRVGFPRNIFSAIHFSMLIISFINAKQIPNSIDNKARANMWSILLGLTFYLLQFFVAFLLVLFPQLLLSTVCARISVTLSKKKATKSTFNVVYMEVMTKISKYHWIWWTEIHSHSHACAERNRTLRTCNKTFANSFF